MVNFKQTGICLSFWATSDGAKLCQNEVKPATVREVIDREMLMRLLSIPCYAVAMEQIIIIILLFYTFRKCPVLLVMYLLCYNHHVWLQYEMVTQ